MGKKEEGLKKGQNGENQRHWAGGRTQATGGARRARVKFCGGLFLKEVTGHT